MKVDRIASHDDDPAAPLADRLLLALGMWPGYVETLGVQVVIDAAAQIKSAQHRLPMVAEDWAAERSMREQLTEALKQIQSASTVEECKAIADLALVDGDSASPEDLDDWGAA